MHDLGHGIYSHLFDRQVMQRILSQQVSQNDCTPVLKWEHEDASKMLIQKVSEDLNAKYEDFITPSEIRLVQDLVKGEQSRYTSTYEGNSKAFLFDIVANKKNSFDLDKLDYLNRDTIHT